MDRALIATDLQTKIRHFEGATEDLLMLAHSLYADLISARRGLNVSAPAARRILERQERIAGLLSQIQAETSGSHVELDVLKEKLGLRTTDTGVYKEEEIVSPTGSADVVQLHAA